MSKRLTLDEACSAIVDCEHKTAPIDEQGDCFAVGTPAMRGNVIDYSQARRISSKTFEDWTRRLVPMPGDLLFAREAPVGPVVQIPVGMRIAPGQRTVLLRTNPKLVDSRYLYYLLTSPLQQTRLLTLAEGSTVPHLNVADVRSFPLPELPSVSEQRAVAATLGALDDKIDSNRRIQNLIEDLVRAIVSRALESSEGVIGCLSDYCTLIKQPVRIDELRAHEKYISFEHMPKGSITLDKWGMQTGLASEKSSFRAGDILFGKLRPYFKKVGIAPVDGVCSSDILVLRPRSPQDTALVAIVASSDSLIDSVSAAATGTRMPRASWRDISSWPVPQLLPGELQSLRNQVSPLIERLISLTHEQQTLIALRDTLVPAMLKGEIAIEAIRHG